MAARCHCAKIINYLQLRANVACKTTRLQRTAEGAQCVAMKTLNLTNLWSVLALSLIIVRAVDTYQSAARPENESNSNTAKLLRTGGRPVSSRRFTSPRSAGEPPAVRQVKQRANIQPGSSDGHDVSVTCSGSYFVLRVKPTFYGLFPDKEELRLGDNCESNGVLRPYGDLLFAYPLTACGAVLQVSPRLSGKQRPFADCR